MMKKNVCAFSIFCASLALFSPVATAPSLRAEGQYKQEMVSYEDLQVGQIKILFNKEDTSEKEETIKLRMKTKEGDHFSQVDFDEDLKALVKAFDQIEPQLTVRDGKLDITLQLHPKLFIKEIIWIGNSQIKTSYLEKELGIRAKDLFNRSFFNKAFHKLKAYYVKKGYFDVQLDYQVISNKENGEVSLQITVKEGKPGFIKAIVLEGFTEEEKESLEEIILTKEYSFFTSWLTNEGTLRPEMLKHDELNILNTIHNAGYLDAKLETKIDEIKDSERVNVRFILSRGKQYTVGNISIDDKKQLFTQEKLLQIAGLKTGDIYSPEQVRVATRRLYDAFGKLGYIDTEVTPHPKRVDAGYVYDLSFTIDEAARYRVGIVKVFGNYQTETNVILHETLLIPGEYFNTTLLQKSEERLRNIGYFKNVNIYATRSSSIEETDAVFRDIHVEVEEVATTANFQAFVAFSTAENLSGGVGLTESNFNIKGVPYIFKKGLRALRGGGEYMSVNATIGTKQLSYTLSWTKPYFLDTPWSLGVDLQKQRNSFASDDYSVKSYSAQVSGRYPLNAFVKFGTHYRIKHSFVTLKKIKKKKRNRELIRESKNGGLISAVGVELYYDSTNHPRAATEGIRSALALEYAGLGGDHTFANMSYLNTMYWALYPKGVFRFRANFQFIKTLGSTDARDLPLDERLYSGGETSIRGFAFNRVGPKFKDKRRTVRGGLSEVFLSAEYKQYLFKKLDGFFFFDAGNVYWKQFHLGSLCYSAGYGIKFKIAENAPLTLGIGYPLNPSHKEDVKKFFMLFETNF